MVAIKMVAITACPSRSRLAMILRTGGDAGLPCVAQGECGRDVCVCGGGDFFHFTVYYKVFIIS